MINEVKGTQQAAIKKLRGDNQANSTGNPVQHVAGKENKSSSGPANEVSLTDTAAKLRQLEAKVASQPVVDTQRVESVKKAIATGSFKIDSGRVADKMAEFESLLASKFVDK